MNNYLLQEHDKPVPYKGYNAKPNVKYTAAQIAGLIRQELKRAFPSDDMKFSVRKSETKTSRVIYVEILSIGPYEIYNDIFLKEFFNGTQGWRNPHLHGMERYTFEADAILKEVTRIAGSFDHGFKTQMSQQYNYTYQVDFKDKEPVNKFVTHQKIGEMDIAVDSVNKVIDFRLGDKNFGQLIVNNDGTTTLIAPVF